MIKTDNERVILHCDMNNFFASVECLYYPEYKNVPMAVAGNKDDRHGIILAKNNLAKKYGVQTAETIWQAKNKCENLKLVPPHFDRYKKYSDIVNQIYLKYTDLVEPFSIDESWLDVTGSKMLFGTGTDIAKSIRNEIMDKTSLTLSIGVSFNKIFAKLGSDYKKPDAITEITKDNFKDILFPLPVSDMLFVGKSTLKKLNDIGIKTIGDLAICPVDILTVSLGKMGKTLHIYANGLDDSPVCHIDTERNEKSISNGLTFKRDLKTKDDIMMALFMLADEITSKMRKKNLKCTTVKIEIKNVDKKFSRQKSLPAPENSTQKIVNEAYDLIEKNYRVGDPIRNLTVGVSGFYDNNSPKQLSMFCENDKNAEKYENMGKSIDKIRNMYGFDSIMYGSKINSDLLPSKKEEENEN